MSILICGIEMPKEGTVFVIDSAGQVWSNEWPTRGYTRLDGVTAVPVQPHGRLIDADALLNELQALYDERKDEARYTGSKEIKVSWNEALFQIIVAPIIIPAEEGE